MTDVRKSPWGLNAEEPYRLIAGDLPAVFETEMLEWQRRVDRNDHGSREWADHTSLLSVVAHEMVQDVEGVWFQRPGSERHYLVAARSFAQAADKVLAHLKNEEPDSLWAVGMRPLHRILILV